MKTKQKLLIIIILLLFVTKASANSENDMKYGRIAIFAVPQKIMQMNALAQKTLTYMIEIFNKGRRFIPVETNSILAAFNQVALENPKKFYEAMAKRVKAEMYAIIDIKRQGRFLYGTLELFPLSNRLQFIKKKYIVRSRISLSIPFKLGKEVLIEHQKMPLLVSIIKKQQNNHIVNAGQFHGLKKGSFTSKNGESFEVLETGRYTSIVKLSERLRSKEYFILNQAVDIGYIVKHIDKEIEYNIHKKYGLENSLLRGQDPEKRILEGLLIVNPLANACLPAYGSFLSVEYMGFKARSADYEGMLTSFGVIMGQLFTVPIMTDFGANFWPFINGSKSKRLTNLHIFLWSSLPLTFSATYMDQLARQYISSRKLPPFFQGKDSAAAVFSLFIPGGGYFYKGHRMPGWVFFMTEMALVSYGIYAYPTNKKNATVALGVAGAIKLIEIVTAYIISPAYRFYNQELDGDYYRTGFSVSSRMTIDNKLEYTAAVNLRF